MHARTGEGEDATVRHKSAASEDADASGDGNLNTHTGSLTDGATMKDEVLLLNLVTRATETRHAISG
jgi:hypothetical protein